MGFLIYAFLEYYENDKHVKMHYKFAIFLREKKAIQKN